MRFEISHMDFSHVPNSALISSQERYTGQDSEKQITLRLDPDVLAFFRKSGKKATSTMINAVAEEIRGEPRKAEKARRGKRPRANDSRTSCTSSALASKSQQDFVDIRVRQHSMLVSVHA